MDKLANLASLIRSKNAEPIILTFGIIFNDQALNERVNNSGTLTRTVSKVIRAFGE